MKSNWPKLLTLVLEATAMRHYVGNYEYAIINMTPNVCNNIDESHRSTMHRLRIKQMKTSSDRSTYMN